VFLYGVVNASPDSLHEGSIATTPDEAVSRARRLLTAGADALDVGGQGSTDQATVVDWPVEWERLADIVPALAALGVELSIDSWRPEVVRRALEAGATVINAADGMQSAAMWEVAAEFDVAIPEVEIVDLVTPDDKKKTAGKPKRQPADADPTAGSS